ncbi:radical SAM protein [Rubrivivax gelatinosus]|nr:radical SAM protein [Rubrivivax gelatinosus]
MSEQTIVLHPRAGTLAADSLPAIVGHRVELQLLTTLRCNLKCSYCSIAEGDVRESQGHVNYTPDQLDAFIAEQLAGKEVYVTFYGGEPTLNRPFIEAVMQRHPLFRFQLQTNGTLLDDLSHHVLQRLSNVLVSIDGGPEVTDGYRGKGIYKQILRNIGLVRDSLGGTLTARVTWSDEKIGFDELDALTRSFDYVYFQFVAGDAYSAESVERRKAVLTQLVERFFADTDRVYPFIPLMGAVRNKLFPSRAVEQCGGGTACRVSTHILNVMPDGRIFACPDLMHLPEMQTGDIVGNWLRRSPLQPDPKMPCNACEAQAWCRGNCMKNLYLGYVREDGDWRAKVTDPICELVRHLGREIDRHDAAAWFEQLPLPQRRVLLDCEVYQYVEVMP